jgi:diguanylate cyclase (GGDEF)-like protein
LLEESEHNIFNLLLRQLLNAIDRIENIEEIRNINNELKKSSVTDYLTGLKNRDGFYGKLKQLVKAANDCDEALSIAILYIDLDNFKYYNDTFGHDVGDLILKEIAAVLSSIAGNEGFATRYGGDEFLITMVNCTKQNAMATAQLTLDTILAKNGYVAQISNFLERQVTIPRAKSVTCSIGVAYNKTIRSNKDLTELIKHADEALYEIKHSTKNGIKFF